MARSLIIDSQTIIPAEELSVTFARSSGPGGQNVNKVNSKAILRWRVADTDAISAEVRSRFLQRFASRVNQAGEILISSEKYRDQGRNISDCHEKLRQLIQTVLSPPRKRKITKPTKSSVEKRLANKKERSQRKKSRRFEITDE